jgi:FkbM family methyltransferase
MVHYNFIEIGTSDFDTLIQTCADSTYGLSIEPLKIYIDRLPDKPHVKKVNTAVSDAKGAIQIYYVDPVDIAAHRLPEWVKGCNSVNRPHPTVVKELTRRGLSWETIIRNDMIDVITFTDIVNNYDVESVDILKIDTEGHDCVILNDYIRVCDQRPELFAKTIIFEVNCLSSTHEQDAVIQKLLDRGYTIVSRNDDIVMKYQKSNDEGYVLCAFDDILYFRLCDRIIQNIRKYDKARPIHILTNNIKYFKKYSDPSITSQNFDFHNHMSDTINYSNTWNKYGFTPKLYQMLYSPFKRSCFFDVDMIFYQDFTKVIWSSFENTTTPFILPGVSDESNMSPSDWHWGHISVVSNAVGKPIPQISSTAILYTAEAKQWVNEITDIIRNLKSYNTRQSFRDGYPDEIVFSILLGRHSIHPNHGLFTWFTDSANCDVCNKGC